MIVPNLKPEMLNDASLPGRLADLLQEWLHPVDTSQLIGYDFGFEDIRGKYP